MRVVRYNNVPVLDNYFAISLFGMGEDDQKGYTDFL